jgi:hypothetical protein
MQSEEPASLTAVTDSCCTSGAHSSSFIRAEWTEFGYRSEKKA